MKTFRATGCGYFTTVLGLGSDETHKEHLHSAIPTTIGFVSESVRPIRRRAVAKVEYDLDNFSADSLRAGLAESVAEVVIS
jgi:hypothetical protein